MQLNPADFFFVQTLMLLRVFTTLSSSALSDFDEPRSCVERRFRIYQEINCHPYLLTVACMRRHYNQMRFLIFGFKLRFLFSNNFMPTPF